MTRFARTAILAATLFSQVAFATQNFQTELTRSFLRTGTSRDAEALAAELTRVPAEFEAKRAALVQFLLSQEAQAEAGSAEDYRARGLMLDLVVTQARDSLYWQEYSKNLSAAQRQRYVATGTGVLIGAALGVLFNRFQKIQPIRSTDPTQQFVNVNAANNALREAAKLEVQGLEQSAQNYLVPVTLSGKQVPVAEVQKGIEAIVSGMQSAGPTFAQAPVSVWTRISNTLFGAWTSEAKQAVSVGSADEALERSITGQVGRLQQFVTQAAESTGDDVAYAATGTGGFPPLPNVPGFVPLQQFTWGSGQMPVEAAEAAYRNVASVVQSLKNTGGFGPIPGGMTPSLEAVGAYVRNPTPTIGPNTGLVPFPGTETVAARLIPVPFTSWQVAYVAGGVPGRSAVTRPAVGAILGGSFAFAADSLYVIGTRSLEPPIVSPQKRKSALTTETGLDAAFDSKKIKR